jgi:hypothetical protein
MVSRKYGIADRMRRSLWVFFTASGNRSQILTALLGGLAMVVTGVLTGTGCAISFPVNAGAQPDRQSTAISPAAHPSPIPDSLAAKPAAPRALTAAEERATFLQMLAEGGGSDEPWTHEAKGVFEYWRVTAHQGRDQLVRFSPVRCYLQGCTATIRYAERIAFDLHGRRLPKTDVFRKWRGAKWRSGPVVTNEGVEATWILFAPPPAGGDRRHADEGHTGHAD